MTLTANYGIIKYLKVLKYAKDKGSTLLIMNSKFLYLSSSLTYNFTVI